MELCKAEPTRSNLQSFASLLLSTDQRGRCGPESEIFADKVPDRAACHVAESGLKDEIQG